MTEVRAVLRWQLEISWSLWVHHRAGLTEAESHWEAAQPCWGVRRTGHEWFPDWEDTVSEPAAVTIDWLAWHIGMWWTQTLAGVAGQPIPPRTEIGWPGSIDAAADWLQDVHDQWVVVLGEAEPVPPAVPSDTSIATFTRATIMQMMRHSAPSA